MSHEAEHAVIAEWAAKVERDRAIIDDPVSNYTDRAAATASLNAYVGPRYRNLIRDHLLKTHVAELIEPWPTTEELVAAHNQAHERGMPPCSTNELEAEQDIGALLEASLARRGRLVP
jgi:hypothetical protein